ncbi:hypothetical protein KKF34_16490 [Myxococcota bacterium]|nr:hypothetical protein [Myxococcota bacterium]MBU1379985.1 hypothetical protein [Myxococcota bacterium]MBU1498477.1 hypothetical protein [Myxococcota bacterium]
MLRSKLLFIAALFMSAVFLTACPSTTVKQPLTFPAAKISKTNTVNITYLTYNTATGGGNTHPARITVGPNPDDELNIGISGNLSGGLGGSWQAAVWIASMQAALSVGRDLSEYSVNVRGQGYIDGPSAGALFTAGIMAAMTGTAARNDVSMTGTVNPDGSIGPVGGIPNKFAAAIAAGKKILGYPVGQRFSTDLKTNLLVDLEQLAQRHGAQAFEMSSIYDSFRILTGHEFPKPEALDANQMQLNIDMVNLLRKKAGAWNNYYIRYSNMFTQQKLTLAPGSARKMDVAKQYLDKAVDLVREGSLASAYDFAQRGGGHSFTSYWHGMFYKILVITKDPAVLEAALDRSLIKPMVDDLGKGLNYLKKARPVTIGDLMAILSAYEQMIGSFGYMYDATSKTKYIKNLIATYKVSVAQKKDVSRLASVMIQQLRGYTGRAGLARLKFEKAIDFMEFKTLSRAPVKVDHRKLRKLAKSFVGTAQANLKYINEIILAQYTSRYNKTMADVQSVFMSIDNNYLQAFYSLKIPEVLFVKSWGENDIATSYAQVAGAMGSYFASSMFLVKQYSLVVKKNAYGEIESVKMQKALVNMLKHAELNARIHAARALKVIGEVPPSAKIFYNIGNTMKDMNIALKIKALEMFWRTSMECQVAISLHQ